MTPSEIRLALYKKKKYNYRPRIKESVFENNNGKIVVHDKLPSYLILKQTENKKILKGVPASMGKTKGIARICLSSKDIKKMQSGDILVSPSTTPDYILGFRKASAIITDEGGLTCHAAVVSREMHLPCVVGTKVATKILNDGDLLLVDANKGIIKKLNK